MPLPIALQLYTVRDPLARDVEGTLAKVAGIGYRAVEVAGLHGKSPGDFRKLLDQHSLKAIALHVDFNTLKTRTEQAVSDATALGCSYLVCPSAPSELRSVRGYHRFTEELMQAGEKLRRQKLTLCYHNHDFEFAVITDQDGSTRGMETIFNESLPSLLRAELDLYWAAFAGEDPMTWLQKLAGRVPLLHVKDMKIHGGQKRMTEVGTGVIRYDLLVKEAPACGVKHLIIEQDENWTGDPLASAATSFKNLSRVAGAA